MPHKGSNDRKEYLREWREKNPDYISEWNADNEEHKQELNKQYNEENALREKARKAAWYKQNREKARQAQREYYQRKKNDQMAAALEKFKNER